MNWTLYVYTEKNTRGGGGGYFMVAGDKHCILLLDKSSVICCLAGKRMDNYLLSCDWHG